MKEEKKPVKGIKIRNVNIGMMLLSCVLYIFLILVTIRASGRYNVMTSAMEDYMNCEADAVLVQEGSDYLTEQVRLYTVTFDTGCVDAYFEEAYTVRRRDTALEHLKAFDVSSEAYDYLQTALTNSNELMKREIYAMKLIALAQGEDPDGLQEDVRNMELTEEDKALSGSDMIEKARDMVFGDGYRQEKESITDNISYFIDSIVADTLQEQRSSVENLKRAMTEQRLLISVLFIENLLTFILIILLVIRPLKIYIENIEGQEKLHVSGSYEFKYLALTYNNIYELNATNKAMLNYRAEHDPLTGIMNRGAFENLRHFLRSKQSPIALMIIDVDNFKQVNDGYGHETGDRTLKKVAKLLEESFRSTDYPARIGGDEFAVIIPDATREMTEALRDKVKCMNDALMNPEDGLPRVSLSVGVAFSECGFEDTLYKKADSALYQVKADGKCGCAFYEQGQDNERKGKSNGCEADI
ncbi:MAG: GGDEF domain-containing protein [bacterium]|nr:GGDEF domain-containing protein [bacterium]